MNKVTLGINSVWTHITNTFLASLVLNKIITREEAKKIDKEIGDKTIPNDWEGVIEQLEEIIKRKL